MSSLDSAAEIQKVAHNLGVEPSRLSALRDVPPEDLRTLRRQLGEALFQADKHHFSKVAALSKAVPIALAAKITQFALPPLIAARTAELIEPQRAVELVHRLSDAYLADVSQAMDASRAPEVIAQIPPERVAHVAKELGRREEWVVIGSFVAQVSDAALRASVGVFTGEQLLRTAFVLDDMSRLDDIAAMITDEQLDTMIAAGAGGLFTELDELLSHLGPERRARMAEHFAAAPASVQDALRAAAADGSFSADGLRRISGET
jgi:MgtE intracellular N domain